MNKNSRVFVAGHRGMVGSAIVRRLQSQGYNNIIVCSRNDLDLENQADVRHYFKENNIDQVYLAAAKVGGIHANNTFPADFIYENLAIQSNVIHFAHKYNVQKLLFLGSSCIYPRNASQPMSEDALLTGVLEPTNEPYAIAKIAGIKMCESYNRQYGRDYRSVMPTNLYGPGDNFHPENSHVIPALLRRLHDAKKVDYKEVIIWGSGKPLREFLHVDDMASACTYVMEMPPNVWKSYINPRLSHFNVGTGIDWTIRELAEIIAEIVGFNGKLIFDTTKPDGAPRKLLDVSRLTNAGWKAKINLEDGLKQTYDWFLNNHDHIRS